MWQCMDLAWVRSFDRAYMADVPSVMGLFTRELMELSSHDSGVTLLIMSPFQKL